MKDILLIGGMGSGKTTLAKALQDADPSMNYVYLSQYNARIPLTLIVTTHPKLLEFPKEEYIKTIL
ncbi:EutP/PduV family microcompartment system protein, partial [Candidatus Woesearchaeota archaeon]|nr:EutP/PduV family microcompartment system protein [Candidatus Woesearchaeota archaeon]